MLDKLVSNSIKSKTVRSVRGVRRESRLLILKEAGAADFFASGDASASFELQDVVELDEEELEEDEVELEELLEELEGKLTFMSTSSDTS